MKKNFIIITFAQLYYIDVITSAFYTFEHLKRRIFKDKKIIKYIWVNIMLQLFYLILKERRK
jgi:hypothetical protein